MIFSKKEITTSHTVEWCGNCKKEHMRGFKVGDYLFRDSKNCSSCSEKMKIVKIFGETTMQ